MCLWKNHSKVPLARACWNSIYLGNYSQESNTPKWYFGMILVVPRSLNSTNLSTQSAQAGARKKLWPVVLASDHCSDLLSSLSSFSLALHSLDLTPWEPLFQHYLLVSHIASRSHLPGLFFLILASILVSVCISSTRKCPVHLNSHIFKLYCP